MATVNHRRAAESFAAAARDAFGPRIDRIVLFGSVARGDATEGSDVDILVVVDHRDARLLRGVYALADEASWSHGVDVSVKVLGREHLPRALGTGFMKDVESEGVSLA